MILSILRKLLYLHFFLAIGPVLKAEKISYAPHNFTLADGYSLEKVAAPPLVQRPIHMSFDENGVLYVTDSSGNTDNAPAQLKDPSHRIMRLVDEDGDGTFDASTLFADKVPFPEGILVHDGSVYVGAPPHIWKFSDTDGDHVADERSSWFNGGSIEGCGNDMHGPYLGVDGYFYWCKGAFDPQSHVLGNGKIFNSSAAHIYRARPDGTDLDVVMTGGMNNPVGLAFSESGERFLSGTFFDLSGPGKRDGILHAVYGGMYGRKNDRVLKPHPSTGELLPILSQMGPAAPSGIVMPKSHRLGLRGDLLCSNFNLRRVSRHRLTPSGSSYTSTNESFLESDQNDFHPTDVIEDADGSLLVADTGSWYMICCPTSKVAKPHVLGAIYRIRKDGTPKLTDPRGLDLDWRKPRVEWLSDERPHVVQRSMKVLAKEDNIEPLKESDARLSALWTLHRIKGKDAREAVRGYLDDQSSEVLAAAIHSIGLWRDPVPVPRLIDILGSSDPLLVRLSAMALGRIGDVRAVKPLIEAGSKGSDFFLKHAVTYALYEIGDTDNLPARNRIADQVRTMARVSEESPSPHAMPDIKMADDPEPDPEKIAARAERLKELAAVLPSGDADKGKALFQNKARSLCLTCHVMGEDGVSFGPDLTGIGSIRSEEDLLEAIIYPSSSIARYYERVLVSAGDQELGGLILKDSHDKIVLSSAPGSELSVPIKEIKSARYSNESLMPKVFDELFKPQEIADMVAYLKTAKLPGDLATVDRKEESPEWIPPHVPVNLPGLHAYAQKSIAAGEEIEFRVSSTVPYELSVVELGEDPENRDNDPVLKTFSVRDPQSQPIHPGSYVHVPKALPSNRRLSQLTMECWIRPFSLTGWQGLITQHDYPVSAGIGLFLQNGVIEFLTGSGGQFENEAMHRTGPGLIKANQWQHVVGTWDGKMKRIYINGSMVAEFPFAGSVRPGKTALRLGAYGTEGSASNFYNGDLAMCALYDEALDFERVRSRYADRGLNPPKDKSVLACWSFSEERGERVSDSGTGSRHGQIINRGTWMIGGPSFDAAGIDRHDEKYDPVRDPDRGHGLRLAADELYNARWEVNHRFRVPKDSKSGVYAGKFDFKLNGKPMRYHATFIVRRPATRPKSPVLVLVSSNTWLAYNSTPFPVNHGAGLIQMGTGGFGTSHPKAPSYSCYSDHFSGQPTYKIGMKVPWPAAGPNKTYIGGGYSHLLRGERFLHLWLDKHGYQYDVITDRDLDSDPDILDGYKVVCINGHSEYWSGRAYDGLDRYLKGGGASVVMSGNTMFWRVSFDGTGEVMECRKFGKSIGGRARAKVGELYHSHDFKRGSLMRFCGYPAWKLVGLTCLGWAGGEFKPYRVDLPEHFLFNEPHKIELNGGDEFGFVNEKIGAVGHEYDVRLSTILKATRDPKLKGLVEPEGIVTVASSHDDRIVLDFNAEAHKKRVGGEQTIAEIIYWERPEGGRVFHTGSIATAWAMYHDKNLSALFKNVLHHFDVKK